MLFLNFGGVHKVDCSADRMQLVRAVGQQTLMLTISVHGTWKACNPIACIRYAI